MPQAGSADAIATYLLNGYWAYKNATGYSFDIADGGSISVDLSGLDTAGVRLARWAMASWESVADIRFIEVRRGAEVTFEDGGSGAITHYDFAGRSIVGATLTVPSGFIATHGGAIDQYAFQTYLHEIGHLFGLGHPGRYDGGASFDDAVFGNDSWQMSVMSYFGQDENPNVNDSRAVVLTPMAADVMALQRLYGAPDNDATMGDTVWGYGSTLATPLGDFFRAMAAGGPAHSNQAYSFLLRDAGGRDRIDFSAEDRPQHVRLGAVVDIVNPGNGSQHAHILIDRGTQIEDYASGDGADRVTGTGAANRLTLNGGGDIGRGGGGRDRIDGGDGLDQLFGGGGGDALWGGDGADLVVGGGGRDRLDGGLGLDRLVGGGGTDRLFGGDAADQLLGGGGRDRLVGGDGTDRLFGGAGSDLLDGGAQGDSLTGGGGADRFVFGVGSGTDAVLDFAAGVDRLLLDAALLAGTDLATVLARPLSLDGETMLRFASGDRLVLHGLSAAELAGLADDILLI